MPLMAIAAGGGVLLWGLERQPQVPTVGFMPTSMHPPRGPLPASLGQMDAGADVDAQVQVLRQRPPFTPGRRAPVAAVADAAAPPVTGTTVVPVAALHGIALSGRRAVAVVLDPGGRLRRVGLGDEIAGWRVTAIRRGSVTFETASAEATVHLDRAGGEPHHVQVERGDGASLAQRRSAEAKRLGALGGRPRKLTGERLEEAKKMLMRANR
jgi:hypothetical protein